MPLYRLVILSLFIFSLLACVEDSQTPDPALTDHPIAYVKRALYDADGDLVPLEGRELFIFRAGSDLYLRDRASPTASERNITRSFTQGMGDVRDVESSYDGSKLLFSMRAPELDGVNDNLQPKWNIWQYDLNDSSLTRIISSNITAELGQDVAPVYLPDGRIVFSSTRQRDAGKLLLDEGKSLFSGIEESRNEQAAVLHIMDSDGSNIKQISFNVSHDLDPTVLDDGRILFSRWDNMGGRDAVRLYTIHPDGSELQIYYGAHSDQIGPGAPRTDFIQPRRLEDGRILTTQVLRQQNNRGGDLIIIDGQRYIDHDQFVANTPGIQVDSGQMPATQLNIQLNNQNLSLGGWFLSAYPLRDKTNRILTSWSPCRLIEGSNVVPCTEQLLTNPDALAADPFFGIYVYDLDQHTQRLVVLGEEGVLITDVVTLRERDVLKTIYDKLPSDIDVDGDLHAQGMGILHIRSVYDFDGDANRYSSEEIKAFADPMQTVAGERPARFIRLVKSVALPDDDTLEFDNSAFGVSRQQLMREILGYGVVEPDGSVMLEVPANVAFTLSILDSNGRRITGRHQMWLQVNPGETLTCNGCHDHNSGAPHGRLHDANDVSEQLEPLNKGLGAGGGGLFPNTSPAMLLVIDPNTNLSTEGYTMAQIRAVISNNQSRKLMADIEFNDVWTDTLQRTADASFAYHYTDLDTTPAPFTDACIASWQPLCRGVINYPEHIQPLWELARVDAVGNDVRCINCHTDDDGLGGLQEPKADLQLDGGASPEEADHLISYRELFLTDSVQELRDGALQDILVQDRDNDGNLLFEIDEEGELILDAEDNPIPIMVTVNARGPSMSTNRANSRYFLSIFDSIDDRGNEPNHANGYLSDAEKRLIAEWLDIGAQYYNNPFDIP